MQSQRVQCQNESSELLPRLRKLCPLTPATKTVLLWIIFQERIHVKCIVLSRSNNAKHFILSTGKSRIIKTKVINVHASSRVRVSVRRLAPPRPTIVDAPLTTKS